VVKVTLLEEGPAPPKPAPAGPSGAAAPARAPKPPAAHHPAKAPTHAPTPKPTRVRPTPPRASAAEVDEAPGIELSEAQLSGAARVGAGGVGEGAGGGGGGACDMAARLQAALRRDPLVRGAVRAAAGRAPLVWNGDWVRSRGEDGKGQAAVREAIMWEVAFAPKACRGQPVRGLILLTLDDSARGARLALGARDWRWSDLLRASPTLAESARR
jgi:hypothetical protein